MDRHSERQVDESSRLMRRVAHGDIEAFVRLYERYCPALRRLFANYGGHQVSLEDLIQEVFTRLWQQRANYRGTSCFLAYLLGIARYTLNDQIRESHKVASVPLEQQSALPADSHYELSEPEVQLYLKELAAAVERARGKLTAKEQQALEISQVPDVVLQEVPQEPVCSREALRSRLKRARKRSSRLLAPVVAGACSSL